MKATGIVRRIDDLGRVVIPKEIRRTMRIREGDPLEIYTDREGEVIFKKYSPIGELSVFAAQYAETLHRTCSLPTIICDRDSVIAVAGLPKRDFADKKLTEDFEHLITTRSLYHRFLSKGDSVTAVEGTNYAVSCAMPITASGDMAGIVASLAEIGSPKPSEKEIEVECKLIQTAAVFLGKQIED